MSKTYITTNKNPETNSTVEVLSVHQSRERARSEGAGAFAVEVTYRRQGARHPRRGDLLGIYTETSGVYALAPQGDAAPRMPFDRE